jgi:hypothetical protein
LSRLTMRPRSMGQESHLSRTCESPRTKSAAAAPRAATSVAAAPTAEKPPLEPLVNSTHLGRHYGGGDRHRVRRQIGARGAAAGQRGEFRKDG